MAHSLTPVPATAITPIAKSNKLASHIPTLRLQMVSASYQTPHYVLDDKLVHRRTVTLSLAGAMLSLNVSDQRQANAARRPAPPPPKDKKDPSVSGVQAKVLASKKRKEAMKQAMAKMRKKGKPVDGKGEREKGKMYMPFWKGKFVLFLISNFNTIFIHSGYFSKLNDHHILGQN